MLLQTTDGHLHHPLDHFSQLRCDDYSLRGTLGALRLLVVGVSVAHFDYTCRMGKRRQLFFIVFPQVSVCAVAEIRGECWMSL